MMCRACKGLIAEPGKVYGYAGDFCHCVEPKRPSLVDFQGALERMSRPRLKRSAGVWVCSLGLRKGFGRTPREAYDAYKSHEWLARVSFNGAAA